MRSLAEIGFRLRQEAANIALRFAAPGLASDVPAGSPAPLPDPRAVALSLQGTAYRDQVRAVAERILAHRFPLLGFDVETGPEIHWRRDALSGIETPPLYFRRIPYLDASRSGDHKVIWELNRHQHLVLLAQEYLFSGERRFLDEIVRQLESWWRDNPFQRGMNWTSALEVAFRASSWMWVWRLISPDLEPAIRRRFATEIFHHGLHLEYNLSTYFSPNTHLLGEAVALHALGRLFPSLTRAARWKRTGGRIVEQEIERQVREDGSHFEQSAYYHLYATDMFLFHAFIASAVTEEYRTKLGRMVDHLEILLGPSGLLPMLGDDDGGRFFHPYSDRHEYALETLAACGRARDPRHRHAMSAWWGDAPALPRGRAAPEHTGSGLIVWISGPYHILFDAGPFGPGSGGHSHADTLSLIVRSGAEEILIDPGAYTYVGDREWRDRFRGTAMHNTVRIDGLDQGEPGTPFSWRTKPAVRIVKHGVAECAYRGFIHRRKVIFNEPTLTVIDEIEGPPGEHRVEQFWHPGSPVHMLTPNSARIGENAVFTIKPTDTMSVSEGGEFGWRSPVLGVRIPAPVIVVTRTAVLPITFTTELRLAT